jgi:hypothetical protein
MSERAKPFPYEPWWGEDWKTLEHERDYWKQSATIHKAALDNYQAGLSRAEEEIERLRMVQRAAEDVCNAAFVTQLNDRAWLLPRMQALEDALFRLKHPQPSKAEG